MDLLEICVVQIIAYCENLILAVLCMHQTCEKKGNYNLIIIKI